MKRVKRVLSVFIVFVFLVSLSSFGGLTVMAADDDVVLTMTSNNDVNPKFRFYAAKENGFDKGGPFKVELEWKADIARMSAKEQMACRISIVEMNNSDAGTGMTEITKSTDGWQKASFSFVNVKGCLDSGAMMPYGVVSISMWYAKGSLSVRNLRITNAAGKVMYSLNDDPDIRALIKYSKDSGMSVCSLRDIGIVNPEPLLLTATFGNDSYEAVVSTSSAPPPTTTTKHGLVIEDTTRPNGTTANGSGDVTAATNGSTSSDPSGPSSSASSSTGLEGSMATTTSGTGAAADANATTPADSKDTGKKSGFPVGGIVAIVIAAVLVLAAAALYILAGTGKVKLPFSLPFLKKGGEAPDNGEPKA